MIIFLSKKKLRSRIKNLLIYLSDGTDSISGATIDKITDKFYAGGSW